MLRLDGLVIWVPNFPWITFYCGNWQATQHQYALVHNLNAQETICSPMLASLLSAFFSLISQFFFLSMIVLSFQINAKHANLCSLHVALNAVFFLLVLWIYAPTRGFKHFSCSCVTDSVFVIARVASMLKMNYICHCVLNFSFPFSHSKSSSFSHWSNRKLDGVSLLLYSSACGKMV